MNISTVELDKPNNSTQHKRVNFAPTGEKMTFNKYTINHNKAYHKKKRMSLITGKQLYYTPTNRHSKRYRHFQLFIYNFLERPSGAKAGAYQLIM